MQRKWWVRGLVALIIMDIVLFLVEAGWVVYILSAGHAVAQRADAPTRIPMTPTRSIAASLPTRSAPTLAPVATATPTLLKGPIPATSFPRPQPGKFVIYRVQPGETLGHISLKFDVSLEELVLYNELASPDRIIAGQELVIPGEGLPTPIRPSSPTRAPLTLVPPAPGQVNGVGVDQFIILSVRVRQNIRKIYAQGQTLGNNPRAFSKVGDSNMETPNFVASFDGNGYNLGAYAYLDPVIDHYAGSFGRQSMAVRMGFHSWSVLDPEVADRAQCQGNETPLACELRLQRPSVVLIRLGTNDAGYPDMLRAKLQAIVEYCLSRGAIPLLGTKADRAEGPDNINNLIIRQVAAEAQIPLWDLDRVTQTLPDNGLVQDRIHLSLFPSSDYRQPEAFQRGHSLDNLTALIALEQVWRDVTQNR